MLVLLWTAAVLVVATVFDQPVAEHVARHAEHFKHGRLAPILKAPGTYVFTVALALLLWGLHPGGLRAALLPLVAGAIGGLGYFVIKWAIGRHRPVYFTEAGRAIESFNHKFFVGGFQGITGEKALSFPSGHATLAFATAASLAVLVPRWRWGWYALAAVVAAERVLENAHFVSDAVAAAGLGIVSAFLARGLLLRALRDPGRAREGGEEVLP